jgi:hypothetical protein
MVMTTGSLCHWSSRDAPDEVASLLVGFLTAAGRRQPAPVEQYRHGALVMKDNFLPCARDQAF